MADFKNTGDAVTNVWQVCLGARFRLRQQRKDWPGWFDVLGPDGEIIGEANDYLYGASGFALHLRDGSYSGFISRDQCDFVPDPKQARAARQKTARKARKEAYESAGMVRVRGNLGGTYYE